MGGYLNNKEVPSEVKKGWIEAALLVPPWSPCVFLWSLVRSFSSLKPQAAFGKPACSSGSPHSPSLCRLDAAECVCVTQKVDTHKPSQVSAAASAELEC